MGCILHRYSTKMVRLSPFGFDDDGDDDERRLSSDEGDYAESFHVVRGSDVVYSDEDNYGGDCHDGSEVVPGDYSHDGDSVNHFKGNDDGEGVSNHEIASGLEGQEGDEGDEGYDEDEDTYSHEGISVHGTVYDYGGIAGPEGNTGFYYDGGVDRADGHEDFYGGVSFDRIGSVNETEMAYDDGTVHGAQDAARVECDCGNEGDNVDEEAETALGDYVVYADEATYPHEGEYVVYTDEGDCGEYVVYADEGDYGDHGYSDDCGYEDEY
jgi:hypothetical protein